MARSGSDALPRSTPAAQGVAAAGISTMLEALAAHQAQLHGLMVLRHGTVIAEGWWRPYAPDIPHALYSLSKSFTSTAVGLAIAEGLLSLDDTVVSFFPEDLPKTVGPNLATMRVRHLLTMHSGHATDTGGRGQDASPDNWVRAFLSLDVEHAPGTRFVYNNGASFMLSAIVQRVSGIPLLEYLTPRLFRPLSIAHPAWESSPRGIQAGGWGLSLTTEDIARFGQLYLRQGRWNGAQLVPESWVRAATSRQVDSAGNGGAIDWKQGYGYQFWRCRHGAYRGDGAYGQYCIVMPDQDVVVAITGGTGNMQVVLDCVWEHLLPAVDGQQGGDAALSARLAGLSLAPAGDGVAGLPQAGRRYRMEPNAAGLDAVTVDASGECRAEFAGGGMPRTIACGAKRWLVTEVPPSPGAVPAPCAGHAVRPADGGLRLDWYFVRTPFGATLSLVPTAGGVEVRVRANVDDDGVTIRGA